VWLYGGTPNKKKYPGSPNANNVRSYARSYTYDKLGNVTQVKQTGSNGFTRNFNYTTGQNTLQLIEDGSSVLIEAFTYDANGNQLTAGTTRNYVWNHADQLLCYFNKAGSANPTVFTQYDYGGQARVSKLVRTGTSGTPIYERTIYIDGVFEYVILENGTTYEKNYIHLMDDQSRMAEVRVNIGPAFPGDISDAVTYTLGDQIGSSVVRLNSSGGFIDKEEYYPFGDSSLRTFTYKRYRYVGKERDAESGLYYYGARYYAAWTCRFISVDPLAAQYVHLTPYNYAGNKPIGDYDIDGMQGSGDDTSGGSASSSQPSSQSTGTDNIGFPSDPVDGQQFTHFNKDLNTNFGYVYDSNSKSWLGTGAAANLNEVEVTATKSSTGWESVAFAAISADVMTPDPTDAALPKWLGEAVLALVATISILIKTQDENKVEPLSPPIAVPITNTDVKTKEDKPDLVYRGGSFTESNFTPRPGKDDQGDLKEGLSTFRTPEQAANPGEKYQIIDLNKIRATGFVVIETPDGHVSIKPPTQKELKEWAATRGTDNVHPRTIFAMFARIGDGRTIKK